MILAGWAVPARTAAQEVPSSAVPSAHVTYISGNSVYIDAGSDRGLQEGDVLTVIRDGEKIATLLATSLSARRAVASLFGEPVPILVGDEIRWAALDRQPAFDSALAPEAPRKPRSSHRERIVRGRVGLRFLQVDDEMNDNSGFSQPALSLRLDASGAASGHVDFSIDTRARSTYRSFASGPDERDNLTRVYRLEAGVHDKESRYVLLVGRQFSPEVASISVFDGILAGLNRKHVSTGIFTGSQPEPIDYGYDTTIREHGAYVQFHNSPEVQRRWSVTTGLVGSYESGEINREFAYFQVILYGKRVSVYATQELDYNRDWKIAAGEDEYSLTSSYVNVGYRVGGGFSLRAGHDDRRNVRLYRDLITPETEFDDGFRSGTWIGFTQRIKKRFRIGLDAKETDREDAEPASTYTLTLGANRISSKNLHLSYRGTHYANEFSQGDLHALNASMALLDWARMTLTGGLRQDTNLLDPAMDDELTWYGLAFDFNIGRQWFLQISSERTAGQFEKSSQSYLGMTYRF